MFQISTKKQSEINISGRSRTAENLVEKPKKKDKSSSGGNSKYLPNSKSKVEQTCGKEKDKQLGGDSAETYSSANIGRSPRPGKLSAGDQAQHKASSTLTGKDTTANKKATRAGSTKNSALSMCNKDCQTYQQSSPSETETAQSAKFGETKVENITGMMREMMEYADCLQKHTVEQLIGNIHTGNRIEQVQSQNKGTSTLEITKMPKTSKIVTEVTATGLPGTEANSRINFSYNTDGNDECQIKRKWTSSMNNAVCKGEFTKSSKINKEGVIEKEINIAITATDNVEFKDAIDSNFSLKTSVGSGDPEAHDKDALKSNQDASIQIFFEKLEEFIVDSNIIAPKRKYGLKNTTPPIVRPKDLSTHDKDGLFPSIEKIKEKKNLGMAKKDEKFRLSSHSACALPPEYDRAKRITNVGIHIGQTGPDGIRHLSRMDFVPVSTTSMGKADVEAQNKWISRLINTITSENYQLCSQSCVKNLNGKATDIGKIESDNSDFCPTVACNGSPKLSAGGGNESGTVRLEKTTPSKKARTSSACKFEKVSEGCIHGVGESQNTFYLGAGKENGVRPNTQGKELELFPPSYILKTRYVTSKPVNCGSNSPRGESSLPESKLNILKQWAASELDNGGQYFPDELQSKEKSSQLGCGDSNHESKPNQKSCNQKFSSSYFKAATTTSNVQPSATRHATISISDVPTVKPREKRASHKFQCWDELYEMTVAYPKCTLPCPDYRRPEQHFDAQTQCQQENSCPAKDGTPRAFICPIWSCRCNVSRNHFRRHLIVEHADLPIRHISLHSCEEFLLDPSCVELGKALCSAVFSVSYSPPSDGTDFLPIFVMAARIEMKKGAIQQKPSTDENFLMIWLTGLVSTIFSVHVTLTVWVDTCISPECPQKHTLRLRPLSELNKINTLETDQYLVITGSEERQLTHDGADLICCSLQLH